MDVFALGIETANHTSLKQERDRPAGPGPMRQERCSVLWWFVRLVRFDLGQLNFVRINRTFLARVGIDVPF